MGLLELFIKDEDIAIVRLLGENDPWRTGRFARMEAQAEFARKANQGDAVDYYILENGVLKKIDNLELRIAAKYLAALIFGLIIGCIVFWSLSEFGI